MAIFGLEQNLAVNPFGKEVQVDKMPEAVTNVEIDKSLETMMKQFSELVIPKWYYLDLFDSLDFKVLTPVQIDLFLQHIMAVKSKEIVKHEITGMFLSRLIQDSYDAGNNNFILNPEGDILSIDGLRGQPNNNLSVIINGCAKSVGAMSSYCNFDVMGSVYNWGDRMNHCYCTIRGTAIDHSSFGSENSIFLIEKDALLNLGHGSEECIYIVNGNVKDWAAANNAKSSRFEIFGDVEEAGYGINSYGCLHILHAKANPYMAQHSKMNEYQFENKDAYEKSKRYVLNGKGNNISLIYDGKIIQRERFGKKGKWTPVQ